MTKAEKNARVMALLFLEQVRKSANLHADRIDPKQRRHYERDPVLRAVDAVLGAASTGLSTARAMKAPGVDLLDVDP